ncbi:PREDICTED: presenilin-like protein At1g08700 isoform X2 [Fragaria vesca subsp. vesca]|uniref:presenilin-like protein At1g08700 isoform X2 n=1 Tax=Fragaria vesca subsp. vesca TaxID=101020 RepID=UPI0002C30F12|nr:PREDICTED: presenilin-like protein At1g08700 isoform X2 [Fragaria vesca subsp. vesca]
MESSVLESIGVEIIGVMSPVSICMFLVVLLVYALSPSNPSSSSSIRTAANLVYLENPTDSTSQKLEGALLNALVFVILIALVTFLLVLLYYYNFTNFLKNYMRFSAFFVLATMGGSIFLSIIQHFSIPIDSITCFLLLFNFTLVGVLSMFAAGMPIFLRQAYMVSLGIIVAAWFTKLPEWTTWVLLVALALYDLVAVLAPGGPLKLLVELASSRDEELPALVYEARPTMPRNASALAFLVAGFSDSGSVELQAVSRDNASPNQNDSVVELDSFACDGGERNRDEGQRLLLVDRHSSSSDSSVSVVSDRARQFGSAGSEIVADEEEMSPLVQTTGSGNGREQLRRDATEMFSRGLGCTLILLSVCHRALPALPISIALGVIFYFLTRLLMEPFVVGTSTNLLMF